VRLLLLRHAKSDWGDKSLDDHDRPLSRRGIEAAPRMAAYMRTRNYTPDLVKCSTSRRTRETLELIAPAFASSPKIEFSRRLYLAERRTLLEEIRSTPAQSRTLMLIGHNPGMGEFAQKLAALPEDDAEAARQDRLALNFSTAALAVFEFDAGEWREVGEGRGRLIDFVRPKDLPEAANLKRRS
jgi:phosphohistidine phosphatase